MALVLLLALALGGCGLPGTIGAAGHLPAAVPPPTATPLPGIQFPQDEAPHHDLTEWWYITGHLRGVDAQGTAHDYGFEFTIFQSLRGDLPPYYAAHFAISDLSRRQFHYAQQEATEPASVIPPAGSTAGFNLAVQGWTAHGLNGHDTLAAAMPSYSISLALTDELPHPILHGGNGVISYGTAGFSYYYSRPLMAATGTVRDHGVAVPVTGQAWFDHQWGNFLTIPGSGWNWYSMQLSNHTEYMIYMIFDAAKQPVATVGTYVAADGSAHEIPAAAISTRATGSWTSPVTGGVYPSGWQVRLNAPSASLTLAPALLDQELVVAQSTGNAYWEGTVSIVGQAEGAPVTGEGYVELTGYARVPSAGGVGTIGP